MTALHIVGWAVLVMLGLAACLTGMLSVAISGGGTEPRAFLS